jgi:hypothetical protein
MKPYCFRNNFVSINSYKTFKTYSYLQFLHPLH